MKQVHFRQYKLLKMLITLLSGSKQFLSNRDADDMEHTRCVIIMGNRVVREER